MRLSHKRKLTHKKGIPQRAWIGRCNRKLLRWIEKSNFAAVNSVHGNFKSGVSGYKSIREGYFVRAVVCSKKRSGRLVINVGQMFRHAVRRSIFDCLMDNGPSRGLPIHNPVTRVHGERSLPLLDPRAAGGALSSMARVVHMSPEPTMLMVPSRVGKGSALESMIKSSNGACAEVRNDLSNKPDKELSKPKQSILSVLKGKVSSFFKKNRSL
ncbi:hypothetical protein AAFX26_15805 (plasmid) [Vibrio alginolyticus]|uniref:hypothetical protein n=1 Tax=Vibrio alginolyticus TaxID=663 RepID=UPI0038CD5BD4